MLDISLSIVIPVFNKSAFTKSCLKDLSSIPADHQIIVVDNGSTDDTQQFCQSFSTLATIDYIRNQQNLGFAKACNIGYQAAVGRNVMFLNNDIRVKSDHATWTQPIIAACLEGGLVGPTMGQLDDQLNFVREANAVLTGRSYMSGWCLSASKETWKQLEIARVEGAVERYPQLFSEDFFCYYEDTDISFRAREKKIPLNVINIPVVHFGKQTSKQLNTYDLYKKAKSIFVKKWAQHIKN